MVTNITYIDDSAKETPPFSVEQTARIRTTSALFFAYMSEIYLSLF